MHNPYVGVWLRRARRTTSALSFVVIGASVLLAASVMWPVAQAVAEAPDRTERLAALLLRLGTLGVGTAGLWTYTAIVRSTDRDLLALLPVNAAQVVWAALLAVLVEGAWLPLAALVAVGPVWVADPALLPALASFLFGSWTLGVVASGATHLAAVQVAEHPRWAPWLDLVRGANLRAQAAFVYAPGATLAATGLLVAWAGDAAARGALGTLIPFVAALAVLPTVGPLAHRGWFPATAVLADIDGRHAAVEGADDARRVAWEGLLPWMPQRWRPWALRDLRHGWRGRRTWVSGAWILGVVALALGWQEAPDGPRIAAAAASTAVLALAAVSIPLSMDEPPFLRVWLPPGGWSATAARATVVAAWLQPAVLLPAAGTLLRSGSAFVEVVIRGEVACALGVAGGLVASRWRDGGVRVYVPFAVVGAAAAWTL